MEEEKKRKNAIELLYDLEFIADGQYQEIKKQWMRVYCMCNMRQIEEAAEMGEEICREKLKQKGYSEFKTEVSCELHSNNLNFKVRVYEMQTLAKNSERTDFKVEFSSGNTYIHKRCVELNNEAFRGYDLPAQLDMDKIYLKLKEAKASKRIDELKRRLVEFESSKLTSEAAFAKDINRVSKEIADLKGEE